MKKLIITAIAAIVLTQIVNAQDVNTLSVDKQHGTDFYKHEIGVSYGVFPFCLYMPFISAKVPVVAWNFYKQFAVNFDYAYNFDEKHAIMGLVSYLRFPFEKDSSFDFSDYNNQVAFLFGYKYTYFSRKNINIYLIAGLGGLYLPQMFNKTDPSFWFSYQVSPFCLSVGKQHNFDVELGAGMQGILKVGYKYKFNGKNQ